ncbi:MAG: TauD/TfdA family dioxygenase [Oceanospirillaceae bacterium]|nr:TauD/TfdA family dioxygenase [Oceanospirillaceae bacterium]
MSILIDVIDEQKQVSGLDFPLVIKPHNSQVAENKEQFNDWVAQNYPELKQRLIVHGAILFRGFPLSGADDFEQMLNHTDFENMPYVGGAAPRSQVTASRIVTANESPASEKIPFHHEMAQVPKPPGYIFFYCDIAPSEGGATSILHSAEICKKFFEIDPEFAASIEASGVSYKRVMPLETDKSSAIGRSWRDTFLVETKEQAEHAMQEAGMSWEWLDDGGVATQTAQLPAIRLDPETHEKVFFNSIVAVFTGWNDRRNKGETSVVGADDSVMNPDVISQLVKDMDELCVNFKWQEGDVLWVNNHTVMHARQPFKGDRLTLASICFK